MVTFDESETGAESCCNEAIGPNTINNGGPQPGNGGGRVGAVIDSPCIMPGTEAPLAYNHFSALRWMEDNWGLSHLGDAATEALRPFGTDVFSNPECNTGLRRRRGGGGGPGATAGGAGPPTHLKITPRKGQGGHPPPVPPEPRQRHRLLPRSRDHPLRRPQDPHQPQRQGPTEGPPAASRQIHRHRPAQSLQAEQSHRPRPLAGRTAPRGRQYDVVAMPRRNSRRPDRQIPDGGSPPTGRTVADKLSIWPLDSGQYGIDASFQGRSGFERMECTRRR